jgi:hypothetical protein
MAALKLNRLKEIIRIAYAAGHAGCLDLQDLYADEVLQEITKEIQQEGRGSGDWRLFSAEELRKMPVGTIFEHSRLGRCWIDGSENRKCMTFADGNTSFFVQNIEPWDEPMRNL